MLKGPDEQDKATQKLQIQHLSVIDSIEPLNLFGNTLLTLNAYFIFYIYICRILTLL